MQYVLCEICLKKDFYAFFLFFKKNILTFVIENNRKTTNKKNLFYETTTTVKTNTHASTSLSDRKMTVLWL